MIKKYSIGLAFLGLVFCLTTIGAHAQGPTLFSITSDKGVGVVTLKVGETLKFTATIGLNKAGWTGSEDLDILGANTDTLHCGPTTYSATQATRVCKAGQAVAGAPDSEIAVYVRGDNIIQRSNAILVNVGEAAKVSDSAMGVTLTGDEMTIVGQPDLTIKVYKAVLVKRKINGFAKKQYKIGVTLRNAGDADADAPLYFSFSTGPKGVRTLPTNSVLVKAGTFRKVFATINAAEKGKKYFFMADPENKIGESIESNNKAMTVVGQ